jgi:hypothetical protein
MGRGLSSAELFEQEGDGSHWGRRVATQNYTLSPDQGTERGQNTRFKPILARLIQRSHLAKAALQYCERGFSSRMNLAESAGERPILSAKKAPGITLGAFLRFRRTVGRYFKAAAPHVHNPPALLSR